MRKVVVLALLVAVVGGLFAEDAAVKMWKTADLDTRYKFLSGFFVGVLFTAKSAQARPGGMITYNELSIIMETMYKADAELVFALVDAFYRNPNNSKEPLYVALLHAFTQTRDIKTD